MSADQERFDDLTPLEAALASLAPRTDRLDREEWMFLAGQASRDRRRWMWPAAFSAMTAVAAILLVMLLVRPSTQDLQANDSRTPAPKHSPKEQPERLPRAESRPQAEEALAPAFASAYFAPRPAAGTYPYALSLALEHGVDWWPKPSGVPGVTPEMSRPEMSRSALSNRELLNELLNNLEPPSPQGRPSTSKFINAPRS